MGDRRSYPGLLLLGGDPGGTVHDGHCDVLLRVPAGQLGPQHRDRGPSENSATATEYRSLNGYAACGRLTISGTGEPSGSRGMEVVMFIRALRPFTHGRSNGGPLRVPAQR